MTPSISASHPRGGRDLKEGGGQARPGGSTVSWHGGHCGSACGFTVTKTLLPQLEWPPGGGEGSSEHGPRGGGLLTAGRLKSPVGRAQQEAGGLWSDAEGPCAVPASPGPGSRGHSSPDTAARATAGAQPSAHHAAPAPSSTGASTLGTHALVRRGSSRSGPGQLWGLTGRPWPWPRGRASAASWPRARDLSQASMQVAGERARLCFCQWVLTARRAEPQDTWLEVGGH